MLAITKEPISIQFWARFIALAITKRVLMDSRDINIGGKAVVLVIVWLVAYNYIF
jgi:hypothetical protein